MLNFGPDILAIISGAILFAAVFLLVNGAYTLLTEYMEQRDDDAAAQSAIEASQAPRVSIEDTFLQQFAKYVTPSNESELAEIKLRLIRAGYRRPSALRVFYLARAVCALVCALLGMLVMTSVSIPLPPPILLGLLAFPFIIGFLLPPLWIDRQAKRRSLDAELGFPDVLDMLLVCIEAGQSFDQACRRVSREIRIISKVLFEEFAIMNDELRAGRDRTAVFRDFSARLNVNDIRAFVTVLRQSDEFGVSIAEALRVYAGDMRNKRLMRAEEKANIMPLKLALGSMAFTVPPTMLVMAGPSLMMLARAFSGM